MLNGSRLTHDYLHTLDVFNERQKELEVIYGFTCDCVVCSLPEAERRISDTRRKEFKMCEDMIAKMIFDAPIPSLHVARHMLDVIKKDNIMGAHKPKVWFYACQVAIVSISVHIPKASLLALLADDSISVPSRLH